MSNSIKYDFNDGDILRASHVNPVNEQVYNLLIRLQPFLAIEENDISLGLAAGGNGTKANGNYTFALGNNVKTIANNQVIFGKNGECNINTLFAIADGSDVLNKTLALELVKELDYYTIKINGMDLYKQIQDNKTEIFTHNQKIPIIEQNIIDLEDNIENCITKNLILNTKKDTGFDGNEIYNAEYVQSEINNINSALENLTEIDANIEYLNNQLNTKQDKIADIGDGFLTLSNNNNIITNLLLPDILEEVDGTTAVNKNYVDSTIQSLREYIVELEDRIQVLESNNGTEEETE